MNRRSQRTPRWTWRAPILCLTGWLTCAILAAATSGWALTTVDVGGNNSATYPATWAGLYSAVTNASARSAADEVLVRISSFDGSGGAASYVRSGLDMTNGLALAVTNQSATYRITIRGGYSHDFSSQSGRTTVDGNIQTSMNPAGQITSTAGALNRESKRVFSLCSAGGLIVLKDLVVTGGGITSGDSAYTSGLGINAEAKVRLSNLVISRNACDWDSGGSAAGGVHLNCVTNHVIEYCTITQNRAYQGGGGLYVTAASDVLIANSTITSNKVGTANAGSGIYSGKQTVLFDCLLFGNYSGSSAFYKLGGTPGRVINCTFADNTTSDPFRMDGSGNWMEMRNCVFADNTGDVQNLSSAINRIGASVFDGDRIMGTYTDEGGVVTNSAMAFKDQPNRDYRLTAACVNAIDQGGYLRTTDVAFSTGVSTVKYVDVDNNGAYGALTDIIVKLESGTPPVDTDYEAHYIHTKDLAGNRRVRLKGIDIGAYEYQPPSGMVVAIK